MERLFVGGIWDGKRQPIPESETTCVAPRMIGPRIEYDHYRVVSVGDTWVFVEEGIDFIKLMKMLVVGYHSIIYPQANPDSCQPAVLDSFPRDGD